MRDVPQPEPGSPTYGPLEQVLGRLQAIADETGDRALESSIVTAQRATASWQELTQRVAYHEHARDLALSLEQRARERLSLVLDLISQFANLASPGGQRLEPGSPQSGPSRSPGDATSGPGGRAGRDDPGNGRPVPGIAVHLLGSFELRVDGHRVEQWRGRRGQAILQFLVAHRRLPVTRDALIEAVWPEIDEHAGRRRLHQAVYALRQTLRDAGANDQQVICANGAYRLDPSVPIWTDVDEFDRLVALGRRLEGEARCEEAFEVYREAEALYRGEFLEGLPYAEWAAGERARLLSGYIELGNRLADLDAERGDHVGAIAVCNRVLTRDSWNEESARRKMRSYAASGNPSLALRTFRSCQDELARELGAPPAAETRALYQEILAGARSAREEMR
jgi:DNA-binding SARP family transcriptional activator